MSDPKQSGQLPRAAKPLEAFPSPPPRQVSPAFPPGESWVRNSTHPTRSGRCPFPHNQARRSAFPRASVCVCVCVCVCASVPRGRHPDVFKRGTVTPEEQGQKKAEPELEEERRAKVGGIIANIFCGELPLACRLAKEGGARARPPLPLLPGGQVGPSRPKELPPQQNNFSLFPSAKAWNFRGKKRKQSSADEDAISVCSFDSSVSDGLFKWNEYLLYG
ncbi:hypothetical protein JRQ81_003028 [Phrynocephalus forsythii]|uniref:Uncharacterized protein n=1 Tax=Phrynocephalus forsythii TaxID=171643 RepID=A0A9Q0XJQ2_9SAUR|nr:hypothetical protein JRQ81_003028 [Phrynocephalus forsythii]